MSDYVNGAIAVGFTVSRVGEWRDADAVGDRANVPRLLTMRFSARERAA